MTLPISNFSFRLFFTYQSIHFGLPPLYLLSFNILNFEFSLSFFFFLFFFLYMFLHRFSTCISLKRNCFLIPLLKFEKTRKRIDVDEGDEGGGGNLFNPKRDRKLAFIALAFVPMFPKTIVANVFLLWRPV